VRIFSPEFNIRLYDKNCESDFFFPSTKIRIFFPATLGIRIFFRKKTIIVTGNLLSRVHHVFLTCGPAGHELCVDPWDPTEKLKEILCIHGSYDTVVVKF
jgi:hypothetical protein